MAASKRKVIGYWVVTLLVLLPMAGSGFPEMFHGPTQTVESLHRLGYPLYLMKITGVAKIMGAIALLVNRPPRLVEWAYAGYSFLLLGATASHLFARDFAHSAIPLMMFLLLMLSYALRFEARSATRHIADR